ncbi:MAG UNVERIFIED_CONTAM: hypothetical protein LVR29_00345 [Microcystis novacekii LVE1205-3]
MMILSPRFNTNLREIARRIASIAQNSKKTILASLMGGEGIAEGLALLNQQGIPTYRYPDSAAGCLICSGNMRRICAVFIKRQF